MPIKVNGQTSGSVTLSAPATGSDVTLTLPGTTMNLATELASKLPIAGGKILQIVRDTDSTSRSTTSTSFVDVTGMSVTITPQKSDSVILLVATYLAANNAAGRALIVRITDASGNAISGGELGNMDNAAGSMASPLVLIAYATPATTSATTYKVQFRTGGSNPGTITLDNGSQTGQLYAIEVAA